MVGRLVAEELVFDPLAVENIGAVLAIELVRQAPKPFPPPEPIHGAGVYALYYGGAHAAYADLVALDDKSWRYPIYVGQTATRKGFSLGVAGDRRLQERFKNHAASIEQTALSLSDFRCRYLVINDAYIGLAEAVLMTVFKPPWNGTGFGSKVVGKFRMSGKPSVWDSIHPGRGGRPAGDGGAEAAAERVKASIKAIHDEPDDHRVRWMLERIRKFI